MEYTDEKFVETYDFLIEYGIATEDEISLACYLCGHTVETLEKVLDIRTGYHSVQQFRECELDEE